MHLPLGKLDPHVDLGFGYAGLGSFKSAVSGAADAIAIRGFYGRVSGGLDLYLSPVFSIGANASWELLALTRPGLSSAEIDRIKGEAATTPQQAKADSLGGRGLQRGLGARPDRGRRAPLLAAAKPAPPPCPSRHERRRRAPLARHRRRAARGAGRAPPRSQRLYGRRRFAVGTALLGALAFVPALLHRELPPALARPRQGRQRARCRTLVYVFVVAAPLEQGLKVAAVAPIARLRTVEEPFDGARLRVRRRARVRVGAQRRVPVGPAAGVDRHRRRAARRAGAPLLRRARGATRWAASASGRWAGVASTPRGSARCCFNGVYDYIVFACRPVGALRRGADAARASAS